MIRAPVGTSGKIACAYFEGGCCGAATAGLWRLDAQFTEETLPVDWGGEAISGQQSPRTLSPDRLRHGTDIHLFKSVGLGHQLFHR